MTAAQCHLNVKNMGQNVIHRHFVFECTTIQYCLYVLYVYSVVLDASDRQSWYTSWPKHCPGSLRQRSFIKGFLAKTESHERKAFISSPTTNTRPNMGSSKFASNPKFVMSLINPELTLYNYAYSYRECPNLDNLLWHLSFVLCNKSKFLNSSG